MTKTYKVGTFRFDKDDDGYQHYNCRKKIYFSPFCKCGGRMRNRTNEQIEREGVDILDGMGYYNVELESVTVSCLEVVE